MWEDRYVTITSSSERHSGTQPTCDWWDPIMAWKALPASFPASPPQCPSHHTAFLQPLSLRRLPLAKKSVGCSLHTGKFYLPVLQISTQAPPPHDSIPDPQDYIKSQRTCFYSFCIALVRVTILCWFTLWFEYANVSLAGKQFKLMLRFPAHTTVPGRVELLSF